MSCSTGRRSMSSPCRSATQLRAAFEALDADAQVRIIVVRAIGEHFSSGGEIRGFLEASPEHVSRLAWNIAAPARCRKPVIAATRGYCFGVGFELALACDFRIVVGKRASMRCPSSGSAKSPARAARRGCRRWSASPAPRTSSCARAACVLGRPMNGALPPNACPTPSLNAATDALVEELRGFPPLAQRTAKKLLNDTEDATLSLAIELEGQAYSRLRSSDDFREGVEAFHAKRKPSFPRQLSAPFPARITPWFCPGVT